MLQTCYGLFFRIIKCHGGQNKKRLASVYANMKVSAKIEKNHLMIIRSKMPRFMCHKAALKNMRMPAISVISIILKR